MSATEAASYPHKIKIEGEAKMKLGNLISKKESKHVTQQTNVQSGGKFYQQ